MTTTNKLCACGKPVFKKDKCETCYLNGGIPDKVFRGNVCRNCSNDTLDRSQKYCPVCRASKWTPQGTFDTPANLSRRMRRLLRQQKETAKYPKRWDAYALFLEKNGVSPETIALAKEQLSGIVDAMQAPVFTLSSAADLDDSDIVQAISQITMLEVNEVTKVSFMEFASQVQGTASRSRQVEIKSQLMQGLGRRFRAWCENPQMGMGAMFFKITDPDRHSSIVYDNDQAIQNLVMYPTRDRLQRTFGRKLGNEIDRLLWTLLRFYTVFILAKHDQGRDLAALGLDLCTQVYPVGSLSEEPKTWRILVA